MSYNTEDQSETFNTENVNEKKLNAGTGNKKSTSKKFSKKH